MIFTTGNGNKLKEFEDILGIKLENSEIDLDEIQSIEVEEVARRKAEQAFLILKQPVIVEDTGLYFEEFNGFPGALIKFLIKNVPLSKICTFLKENRRAKAITCVAYCDNNGVELFIGQVSGEIANIPKGKTDFGWDPIFIPDGHEKTFAEMDIKEKNRVSMRKKALEKLKSFLIDKK